MRVNAETEIMYDAGEIAHQIVFGKEWNAFGGVNAEHKECSRYGVVVVNGHLQGTVSFRHWTSALPDLAVGIPGPKNDVVVLKVSGTVSHETWADLTDEIVKLMRAGYAYPFDSEDVDTPSLF